MTLGSVLDAVNLVKGIGEVGKMVTGQDKGEAGTHATAMRQKKGAARVAQDIASDFSDTYDQSILGHAVSGRAPACYASAMSYMAKLCALQEKVAYATRVRQSGALQAAEKAKAAAYKATSTGFLKLFHGLTPQPAEPLEKLVTTEVDVMASMQKQVSSAVRHSSGIVDKLEKYDTELLTEFDKAKRIMGSLEKGLERTSQTISESSEKQRQTPMDSPNYVTQQIELNNLCRAEKDNKNRLEIVGQQIVDTYKQSSQVRAKEDVVRAGLHELKLVNAYVARFLGFLQQTQEADNLLPQLVETAEAVTNSYQVLTSIVVTGSAGTTRAVEKLVDVIGTVDYRVLPNVQKEVNKQKATLERADKRTSFYEQAVKLLRGENYSATPSQQTPAQSAGSA